MLRDKILRMYKMDFEINTKTKMPPIKTTIKTQEAKRANETSKRDPE